MTIEKPKLKKKMKVYAEYQNRNGAYSTFTLPENAKLPSKGQGYTQEFLGEVECRQEWYEITNKGHAIGRDSVQELKDRLNKHRN